MKKVLFFAAALACAGVSSAAVAYPPQQGYPPQQAPVALNASSVFVLQATPDVVRPEPLLESFRLVRLGANEYRLYAENGDRVTFHAVVEGDRFTAVNESASGPRMRFVGKVAPDGGVSGRFSLTQGSRAVGTGTFSFVAHAAHRGACTREEAGAGWTTAGAACRPPQFTAPTQPSLQDLSDVYWKICEEHFQLCGPISKLNVGFGWANGVDFSAMPRSTDPATAPALKAAAGVP